MSVRRRPHVSAFRDEAGRNAYLRAYDLVLEELWPVPYEPVTVDTRFGRSHAVAAGPGTAPPLVLLPGAGLSATSWYPNVEALTTRFRIYAFDLVFDRGRGHQTRMVHGAADCARWLIDVMDGLGIDRGPVVGLSQGAWVAASAAHAAPERITRLVLLAPAATLRPFRLPFWLLFRGLQDVLPKGDPMVQARRTFRLVGLEPDQRFLQQTARGTEHFREQRPPVLPTALSDEELRAITAPTLLLLAENEVLYNPRKALARARRLIPDVAADLVPGAGHFVAMARPDIVDPRVLAFL